jgi:hypothetical protein
MYSFTVNITSTELNTPPTDFVMKSVNTSVEEKPGDEYPDKFVIIDTQLIINEAYKEILGSPQLGYTTKVNAQGESFTVPQYTGFGTRDKVSTKIYMPRRLDFINTSGVPIEYRVISTRKEEKEFINFPERFTGITIANTGVEQILPLQNNYRILIKKTTGSASNGFNVRLSNFILFQQ